MNGMLSHVGNDALGVLQTQRNSRGNFGRASLQPSLTNRKIVRLLNEAYRQINAFSVLPDLQRRWRRDQCVSLRRRAEQLLQLSDLEDEGISLVLADRCWFDTETPSKADTISLMKSVPFLRFKPPLVHKSVGNKDVKPGRGCILIVLDSA